MANIKQVAKRAGVSSATVSRVLAGSAPVTEAYRDRVLQAVAELGYRPNRIASNLRRQQSQTVGVVVADIGNPHFSELLRTVEAAAYTQGYRVLLCNTDDQAEKQRSYLEVLAAERVQGVILAPSEPNGTEIGELWDLGIPVVAFDRSVTEHRTDAVIADNVEGVRRATELLLDAGHTRVGFISGSAGLQSGDERLVGYEQAMRSRGLEPHVASGDFHIVPAQAAAELLLTSGDGLTGLVVANNLMTIGALRAIRTHGLRIPEDIAIVTIDDPYWAEFVEPPLTAFAQPVRRMAESAFSLLLERIEGTRSQAKTVVYGFDLRLRRSCGTAGWMPRAVIPGHDGRRGKRRTATGSAN
jgi:DNA-binding LacI/PurR family transcriptional regulator